jgi:hypothetical protein
MRVQYSLINLILEDEIEKKHELKKTILVNNIL